MKQTAVEWLEEKILNARYIYKLKDDLDNFLLEQAKEMEKKQIVDAFEHVDFNLDDGQHYFEQTFKAEE